LGFSPFFGKEILLILFIMKQALYLVLLLNVTFLNCYSVKHRKGNDLKGVHIKYVLPYVNWDETLDSIVSDYDFYFLDDVYLYSDSYKFDSAASGIHVLTEKRKVYFIFKKDSSHGRLFSPFPNPYSPFPGRKLPVDSMLLDFGLPRKAFDSTIYLKPDSIFQRNGEIIKVFNRPATPRYPEANTLYFYYSEAFNHVPETFSKMDNIPGKKLYKIRAVFHGAYYDQYKIRFAAREALIEMTAIDTKGKDTIMSYFEGYKQSR
jgi:hypothetical protein